MLLSFVLDMTHMQQNKKKKRKKKEHFTNQIPAPCLRYNKLFPTLYCPVLYYVI